jgi:murein DD-endopeptidase MepM/ murein hydrolase activator NlpD
VQQAVFPEIRLKLPKGKVTLSEADLKRVKGEERRLRIIFEGRSARRWEGSFLRPVETPVSVVFGVKRIMNKEHVSYHRGVDFKGDSGLPVKASQAGAVLLADDLFYGGNTLIIDHGTGIFTIYMHLDRFALAVGSDVRRGETIGYVGSTGRATGPHLHLSLKILGISANPLALFDLPL